MVETIEPAPIIVSNCQPTNSPTTELDLTLYDKTNYSTQMMGNMSELKRTNSILVQKNAREPIEQTL